MMILSARIAALLTLACLTVLFISAGQLVQDASGLSLHSAGAVAIHICAGLLAAALTVHTWRTRSGVPVTAASLALFGLTFVQAGLGSQMTLALHVVVGNERAAALYRRHGFADLGPVERPDGITEHRMERAVPPHP